MSHRRGISALILALAFGLVLVVGGCNDLVCPNLEARADQTDLGPPPSDGAPDFGGCACVIHNDCYPAGARSPNSPCWSCDPLRDVHRWSDRCSWREISIGTQGELTAVHGSGPDDVYVVGLDGAIRHFDGVRWRALEPTLPGCPAYHDVLALGPQHLVAVGTGGCSMHFDGQSWRRRIIEGEGPLHALWRGPSGRLYALGRSRPWQLDEGRWMPWQSINPPSATTKGTVVANLNTDATQLGSSVPPVAWDPVDPSGTSNFSTSMTIYDSLGRAHNLTIYFRREADVGGAQSWDFHTMVDGSEVTGGTAGTPVEGSQGTLTFDTQGRLITETTKHSGFDFLSAKKGQTIEIDFGDAVTTDGGLGLQGVTNYASDSSVSFQSQNGHGPLRTPSFLLDRRSALASSGTTVFIVGATSMLDQRAVGWIRRGSLFEPRALLGGCTGLWGDGGKQLFAVCKGGRILHYDGDYWLEQVPAGGQQDTLWAVWGASPRDVYAVGEGRIRRFDGRRWQTVFERPGVAFNAIWGTAHDAIYAVGSKGTVLRYGPEGGEKR